MQVYFKINAGNDRNGNPRRAFLVFDAKTGNHLATIEEGYEGNSRLNKHYPKAVHLTNVLTTPTEYREWLKLNPVI
jgi:hypothetical protein